MRLTFKVGSSTIYFSLKVRILENNTMNENSISNFRIVICLVVWDEGWFFFPLLSFPSKTLSFWYGSYQSTRLEPPCICGLLCFTLRSQPWALSFLKYTKVHTTWYFMNNSILLPFFLWWWDFQRMWWHQIFLYFSCLTGTLNVANLLFFLEEKKIAWLSNNHI